MSDMYGHMIGLHPANVDVLIGEIKQGLPTDTLSTLSTHLGVTEKTLATIVRIAPRTLNRRKKDKRLTPDESDRVLRVVRLFERAVEVLGDQNSAKEWFGQPVASLGGKTPLEYADTEPGAREIENVLGRIEYGVYS